MISGFKKGSELNLTRVRHAENTPRQPEYEAHEYEVKCSLNPVQHPASAVSLRYLASSKHPKQPANTW